MFLYGMIAYGGLRAAKAREGRLRRSSLAAGITSLILCQALLNIFAVLGLAPLTGVPLPFISYGLDEPHVLLAAMGLLLNIAERAARRICAPCRQDHGDEDADRHRRGGHAGHVVPALAVADALRAEGCRGRVRRRRARRGASSCPPPATSCGRSASRG